MYKIGDVCEPQDFQVVWTTGIDVYQDSNTPYNHFNCIVVRGHTEDECRKRAQIIVDALNNNSRTWGD